MTTGSLDLRVRLAASDTTEAAPPTLLERLRRAEPDAVGEVYDLHHVRVRAFAASLLGDPDAAEDLVHEVFVALPRAIRNFRGDASLTTFLLSIAVHHARHYVRAAARRRRAISELSALPRPAPHDPERCASSREIAVALAAALDALPLEQRVAFVLCEVEERTAGDAAAITGVPEATVRTRLFHARRKLRELLAARGLP